MTGRASAEGYSLVEVVTASVAAGVLVLVALSAFLASQRALTSWEHGRALEADALMVATALARDADRAEGATQRDATSLQFEGTRPIVYVALDSGLVRDGRPMLDEAVRLAAFDVEVKQGVPLVVRFVLTGGGRTVERRIVHVWRGPPSWPVPPDS